MAINVIDKAGNATITSSGTVTSVTSPVYFGPKALQFNSSSGGTVTDGDGKISFTIPTGIGTGPFTIQAFISINSDNSLHSGNHHSDYFIDIGGIQVRFKTSTVSSTLRLAPTAIGYGAYKTATDTGVAPNEYFHFRITRDSSGDIKTWEGDPFGGGTGSLEYVLATGDTTNMNGATIEIGDLGTGAGAFRLDCFEIKTSYSQNTATSYSMPTQDSTSEDIEGDTLVLIDGIGTLIQEAEVSTSITSSTTASANIIHSGVISMSSMAWFSTLIAGPVENTSAALSIKSFFENYIEVGYVEQGYFQQFEAIRIRNADTSPGITTNLSVTAGTIVDAQSTLPINLYVGTQDYIEDNDYIQVNYFIPVVVIETILYSVDIPITVTMSVTAEEVAEATLNIQTSAGEVYIFGSDYTEPGYFEDGFNTNVLRGVDASLSSQLSLSADSNFIAYGVANLTSTGTVSVDGDLEAAGQVSVAISATTSINGIVAFNGAASTSISSSVGITAVAELAGEVSVNISANTTIQANATASGDIEPGITVTMAVSAQAFRVNDRYTLIIPKETRVNTITEETRSVLIPKETRELEFLI